MSITITLFSSLSLSGVVMTNVDCCRLVVMSRPAARTHGVHSRELIIASSYSRCILLRRSRVEEPAPCLCALKPANANSGRVCRRHVCTALSRSPDSSNEPITHVAAKSDSYKLPQLVEQLATTVARHHKRASAQHSLCRSSERAITGDEFSSTLQTK